MKKNLPLYVIFTFFISLTTINSYCAWTLIKKWRIPLAVGASALFAKKKFDDLQEFSPRLLDATVICPILAQLIKEAEKNSYLGIRKCVKTGTCSNNFAKQQYILEWNIDFGQWSTIIFSVPYIPPTLLSLPHTINHDPFPAIISTTFKRGTKTEIDTKSSCQVACRKLYNKQTGLPELFCSLCFNTSEIPKPS